MYGRADAAQRRFPAVAPWAWRTGDGQDRRRACDDEPMKRLPIVHHALRRPRLASSIALAIVLALVLPRFVEVTWSGRFLIAYDAAAILYLASTALMMTGADAATMERRSLTLDDGKVAVLVAVILSTVAALVAIAVHLSAAKALPGMQRVAQVALAAGTLGVSWAFTQMMFAQHYAHEYYLPRGGRRLRGLDFPGTENPSYGDFLYFACIIGTSGQTADVAISGTSMRRFALVHCVFAYAFNTTLLALMINLAAGLL